MGINNVTLSGNLTKQPEMRETQSNKKVTSFSLAINEGKDKVEYVNCVAWEKTAELINNYCNKGDKLVVVGKMQTRKYEKNGENRYVTEVVAFNVDLPPKGSSNQSNQVDSHDGLDDEIPFSVASSV